MATESVKGTSIKQGASFGTMSCDIVKLIASKHMDIYLQLPIVCRHFALSIRYNEKLQFHGELLSFMKDDKSQIGSSQVIINGVEHGKHRTFHKNGRLLSETFKIRGKKQGLQTVYDEEGNMIMKGNYVDDIPDGEIFTWYSNGTLCSRENWKNGKENGLFEKFSENGVLLVTVTQKDSVQVGLHKTFFPSGKIQCTIEIIDGVKVSLMYNQQGIVHCKKETKGEYTKMTTNLLGGQFEVNLKGTTQHGDLKIWHRNGHIKSCVPYIDGKIRGQVRKWYDNGQLEVRFDSGAEGGVFNRWFRSGEKKEVYGMGGNDKRDGEFKEWDIDGNLIQHKIYNDGVMVQDMLG